MQNKDIMSFGSESIYRAFEPKKWYESSHGVLVQKNGNCIRVELVTQFCLLRWICNFFKRFGVNLSEKLSFHELIVCEVYSDPNSVYSDIQRDCVDIVV